MEGGGRTPGQRSEVRGDWRLTIVFHRRERKERRDSMFKLLKIYTFVPINRYRNRHMRCFYAISAYTLRNNSQRSQRAPR